MSTLVRDILAWQARTPDELALLQAGNNHFSISYTELLQNIKGIEEKLQAAGIGRGSTICLALPNSPAFAITFLAAVAIGATVAPLNPALKQAEIQFQFDDFEIDLVVGPGNLSTDSTSDLAKAIAAGPYASSTCYWDGKGVVLDLLQPKRNDSLAGEILGYDAGTEDNVALILHTSGTTGRPKGVPLQESNLLASSRNVIEAYSLSPEDRSILIMPLFHIHGIVAGMLAPLLSGSCIVFPEKGSLNPAFWQDFIEHKATWWTATPTHQKILLSFPPPPAEVKIRFIRSCSSPLSPTVLRRLEETFHAPVLEAYAMTENAHHISTNPQNGPWKPGTVGLPCKSIDLRIVDDHGDPVPIGERGEVAIRGTSVMQGYRHNPEANAKAFTHDGYFRTGDQGVLDSDGYLQLTGRIKELVNKGGEKISANEIDNVILEHTCVAEAVSFAIPDNLYGEDVGAAVVLKAGSNLTSTALKEWLRARMANFKVPSKIWMVDSIPKTATGKVQRLAVAKTMLEKQDEIATTNDTDASGLKKLWSEVLSIDPARLNEDDDFFAIGGDSVAAIRLSTTAKINNLKLDPATVYRFPKFSDMVKYCIQQGPESHMNEQTHSTDSSESDLFTAAAAACAAAVDTVEDVQPLTPLQSLLASTNRSHGLWMMTYTFAVKNVSLRELQVCVEAIRRRNPTLRSRVADINGKLYSVSILDEATFETSANLDEYIEKVRKLRILYGCPQVKYAFVNDEQKGPYFVLAYSHNILDAWSRRLLLEEMTLGLRDPEALSNSAMPQSFQNFAAQVAQTDQDESIAYYLDRLQGYDRTGYLDKLPATQTSRHISILRHIPLTNGSTKSSMTIAAIHLAYALSLRALSGDARVWFPSISSGRLAPLDRIETAMGLTIASVPICLDMSGDMTIRQALDRLLAQMYGGVQHEPFASEAMRRQFGAAPREAFLNCSELPKVDGGYVIEARGGEGRLCLDETKSLVGFISSPLHMRVARTDGGLSVDLAYAAEVYETPYMIKFVDAFTKYVMAIDTDSSADSLDVLYRSA